MHTKKHHAIIKSLPLLLPVTPKTPGKPRHHRHCRRLHLLLLFLHHHSHETLIKRETVRQIFDFWFFFEGFMSGLNWGFNRGRDSIEKCMWCHHQRDHRILDPVIYGFIKLGKAVTYVTDLSFLSFFLFSFVQFWKLLLIDWYQYCRQKFTLFLFLFNGNLNQQKKKKERKKKQT